VNAVVLTANMMDVLLIFQTKKVGLNTCVSGDYRSRAAVGLAVYYIL
jgi:hypothetical protein